jgi:hypothetical protein
MTVVGILFISMPIFNIGCCANSGCSIPPKYSKPKTEDITYEEVV